MLCVLGLSGSFKRFLITLFFFIDCLIDYLLGFCVLTTSEVVRIGIDWRQLLDPGTMCVYVHACMIGWMDV